MADQQGGRAWVFGDDINTDVLAPGLYLKGPIEEMAKHTLEAVDPEFAPNVAAGDIVVGGENFGIGSSREQAASCLVLLGVPVVLAKSYARIFYRNAFNVGLIPLVCPDAGRIAAGDRLRIDSAAGKVENLTQGDTYACDPVPAHLMEIVEAGGLLPHLKRKLANRNSAEAARS